MPDNPIKFSQPPSLLLWVLWVLVPLPFFVPTLFLFRCQRLGLWWLRLLRYRPRFLRRRCALLRAHRLADQGKSGMEVGRATGLVKCRERLGGMLRDYYG